MSNKKTKETIEVSAGVVTALNLFNAVQDAERGPGARVDGPGVHATNKIVAEIARLTSWVLRCDDARVDYKLPAEARHALERIKSAGVNYIDRHAEGDDW